MGGGPFDFGTLFKLKPPARGQTQWTEKVLLSFGSPPVGPIFASKGPPSGTANVNRCKSPPSLPSSPLGLLYLPVDFNNSPLTKIRGTPNRGGGCRKGAVAEPLPPPPPLP